MAKTGRTSRTWPGTAGALLLLLFLLQGCGGSGSQAGAGSAAQGPMMEKVGGGAEMAVVQESATGTLTEGGFDRLVVKTAELGVRSGDVRGNAEEARRVAERFGGEVLSSRVYAGSGPVSADLVLSVPSGEFEAALDELRGLGDRVTTDTVEGQDVTEEFVDLESRERNLLAAETSLLALYDRAESVEDTLTVERELTNIRGQIEEVQGRIQYLERRTATSEIVLHLQPIPHAPPPQKTWSPSLVAARAWDASLGVLQAAATAFISAVVFCWWLLPPAAAGLLVWRRSRVAGTSG